MKFWFGYLFALLLAAGQSIAQDDNSDIFQISKTVTGLLVFNGHQTQYEIILLNERFGVMSAAGLAYKDPQNNVDWNQKYEVMIATQGTQMVGTFKITQISIHPQFNRNTMANPLAIVEFDASNKGSFKNNLAVWRPDWSKLYYFHQTYNNIKPYHWNPPKVNVADAKASQPAGCEEMSLLYSANKKDIICTTSSIPWYKNNLCQTSYNSIYGYVGGRAGMAAIYSYSVVENNPKNNCGQGSKIYSYYTLLQNYIEWIKVTTKFGFGMLADPNNGYVESKNFKYSMTVPQDPTHRLGNVDANHLYLNNAGMHVEPLPASSKEPISLVDAVPNQRSPAEPGVPLGGVVPEPAPTTVTTTATTTFTSTITSTVTSVGTTTSTVTTTVTVNNSGGNQNDGDDINNINVNVQNQNQQQQQPPPPPVTTTVTTTSVSVSISIITVPGPAPPTPTQPNTGPGQVVTTTTTTTDTITDIRYSYITIYGAATSTVETSSASTSTEPATIVTSKIEPSSSSEDPGQPLDKVDQENPFHLSTAAIIGIIAGILALLLLLLYLYRRHNKKKNADWGMTRVRRWFIGDRVAQDYPSYPQSYAGSQRNSQMSYRSAPPRY